MKHNIRVSLLPVKGRDLFPVRLRVSWLGLRCDLPLGCSYNVGKWNKEVGRAKHNTFNTQRQSATEINGIIEDAIRWIDGFFVRSAVSNVEITTKALKTAFWGEFRHKDSVGNIDDISVVFERFFIETAQLKGWSENTQIKYGYIKHVIKEYNLTFKNFNEDFFSFFTQNEIKKGRKNTTIFRNIRLLKVFAQYCFKHGFILSSLSDYHSRLKWSGAQKAVVFLEFDELKKIISLELSGCVEITRDMFVFSCFTGLRFSDIVRLQSSDIYNGKIHVVTKKTSDSLEIELNKYSDAIIKKYISVSGGSFLFPRISIQTANNNLKKLFKNISLDRKIKKTFFSGSQRVETVKPLYDEISFHAGRRTFVVECLRRGIAPAVIMKWTGHSDYSAMKPYIEIVDSLKASEMSKFDL